MRISDGSSDVCSSDLPGSGGRGRRADQGDTGVAPPADPAAPAFPRAQSAHRLPGAEPAGGDGGRAMADDRSFGTGGGARKSVVQGKSVADRVGRGGCGTLNNKKIK